LGISFCLPDTIDGGLAWGFPFFLNNSVTFAFPLSFLGVVAPAARELPTRRRRLLLGFLADWMSGSAYGCHLFFSFWVSMPAGGPSG